MNTLLTTLYVHLDDRILPGLGSSRTHHPGRKPALNDVELLGVVKAQQLQAAAITELARDTPSRGEITRLIASTPVPCKKANKTLKRPDLPGHTGYGHCAWDSRLFRGDSVGPLWVGQLSTNFRRGDPAVGVKAGRKPNR